MQLLLCLGCVISVVAYTLIYSSIFCSNLRVHIIDTVNKFNIFSDNPPKGTPFGGLALIYNYAQSHQNSNT